MPAMTRRALPVPLPAILLSLVLWGCASTGDDGFLVRSLDEPSKARALTAAGIQQYELHLVRKAEFDRIDEVREYFVVALRYDPGNALARKYLGLVTRYRDANLASSVKEASALAQKTKRSEEETFRMSVALQKAARIDPSSADVQKLLADTAPARNAFVEASLARARAAADKVDEKTPDAAREKLALEAFQQASRALAADPRSQAAQAQKASLRASLSESFKRRMAAVQKLIAAQSFPEAKGQLAQAADLNRKLEGSFDTEVRAATYTLNYRWARALADQKEYEQADVRVDAALSVKKTDEAAALKKRIGELRTRAGTAASFESALQDIDRLIARGEWLAAQRRIDAVSQGLTGAARLASLDERTAKIRANLERLYGQAVEAYRAEDFDTAVELLQTVVAIDEGYEQAADYLDKAKAKKELLEQF
jgi:tetratricopeptide (TPR) repeat protein